MPDPRYSQFHLPKDIRGDFNEDVMPQNPINIEAVYTCRHFELPAAYIYCQNEAHAEYELIYVERGPYYDYSEGEPIQLHSGDAIIYGRNYPHRNNCDGKHSATVFITTFLCDSELVRQYFPDNTRTVLRISPEQRSILALAFDAGVKAYDINAHFNKLKSKPPHIHRQIYINYIEILLLNIIKSIMKEKSDEAVFFKSDSNCSEVTAKVISLLESRIYSDISIEEICAKIGYSRGHICAHFKHDTGKTVNDYFQNLKMEEAKRLILETNQDFTLISESLGYSNPQYFNKVFKRLTGYTPGYFRRTIFKGSVQRKSNEQSK